VLGEIRVIKEVTTPQAHSARRDVREPQSNDVQGEALLRQRELADELLHTRQVEPLGEALQRRLAMAERICQGLASTGSSHGTSDQVTGSDTYRLAEVERLALADMLQRWWAWLRES